MAAPTRPEHGRVTSQAIPILPAVLQDTLVPRPIPEPRIDPVQMWVVDRANPRWEEARIATVEAVSEAKPCGASTCTSPRPMVRMMRHPPE